MRINFFAITTLLLLIAGPSGASSPVRISPRNAERAISEETLHRDVEFLSDSLCEGRRTGTRGATMAAMYLAMNFENAGLLKMDRILYTSTHYPANYGFIPRTYADDLDPLDVLVLCSEQIAPLTLIRCYPIGMITMLDNGRNDEKIIAIPFNDPTYNGYTDISELPKHLFDEMTHFFTVYKSLEKKETVVDEVKGRKEALEVIKMTIENYKEKFNVV